MASASAPLTARGPRRAIASPPRVSSSPPPSSASCRGGLSRRRPSWIASISALSSSTSRPSSGPSDVRVVHLVGDLEAFEPLPFGSTRTPASVRRRPLLALASSALRRRLRFESLSLLAKCFEPPWPLLAGPRGTARCHAVSSAVDRADRSSPPSVAPVACSWDEPGASGLVLAQVRPGSVLLGRLARPSAPRTLPAADPLEPGRSRSSSNRPRASSSSAFSPPTSKSRRSRSSAVPGRRFVGPGGAIPGHDRRRTTRARIQGFRIGRVPTDSGRIPLRSPSWASGRARRSQGLIRSGPPRARPLLVMEGIQWGRRASGREKLGEGSVWRRIREIGCGRGRGGGRENRGRNRGGCEVWGGEWSGVVGDKWVSGEEGKGWGGRG